MESFIEYAILSIKTHGIIYLFFRWPITTGCRMPTYLQIARGAELQILYNPVTRRYYYVLSRSSSRRSVTTLRVLGHDIVKHLCRHGNGEHITKISNRIFLSPDGSEVAHILISSSSVSLSAVRKSNASLYWACEAASPSSEPPSPLLGLLFIMSMRLRRRFNFACNSSIIVYYISNSIVG